MGNVFLFVNGNDSLVFLYFSMNSLNVSEMYYKKILYMNLIIHSINININNKNKK